MAQVLFWIFAVLAVIASLGVISLRNSVHSAVSLTGTLVCLAVLYILLGAEFVGVVQIIVYAGAIMVLFLFVVTLLSPGTGRSGRPATGATLDFRCPGHCPAGGGRFSADQ